MCNSPRSTRAIVLLVLMVAAVLPVDAQQLPVSDPFAGMHQRLTAAADGVLAAAARTPLPAPAPAAADPPAPEQAHAEVLPLLPPRRLLSALEPILNEEGVPLQLASVVLVESGGHPQALSPKGALGLWQFMPETARRYGLTVTPQRDDRLDPVRSTRAAARYLRDLYVRFGDWPLALAAYNAGENAVQRAVRQAGAHTKHVSFVELSQRRLLPAETRGYVPAVLASWSVLRPTVAPASSPDAEHRLYATMSPGT